MYFVYGLYDPRDNDIFYVGITDNTDRRLKEHIRCVDKTNLGKNQQIQELKNINLLPYMEVIETVETYNEVLDQENYWIRHYLNEGVLLTNIRIENPAEFYHLQITALQKAIAKRLNDIAKEQQTHTEKPSYSISQSTSPWDQAMEELEKSRPKALEMLINFAVTGKPQIQNKAIHVILRLIEKLSLLELQNIQEKIEIALS